jgi:hypothetical protein
VNREEPAEFRVIGEIAREQLRSCNGSRDVPFAHLHVPEREPRFDPIEVLAAATLRHLADGEESTLLVSAA